MNKAEHRAGVRPNGMMGRYVPCVLFVLLFSFVVAPTLALGITDSPDRQDPAGPAVTQVGVYLVDFNNFDVETGTVWIDFYLTLQSDIPVTIDDFEIMNGHVTSQETILDTPYVKEYRIAATVTVDPDLRRYPFDVHTLPVILEPKLKNEQAMVVFINETVSGVGPDVDLPGWRFAGTRFFTSNQSYIPDEIPYSRAVFSYTINRDVASTILKSFLPFMLIIIVSLFSLLIKAASRLLLNASMFLGAILIHWYLTDAIPLVAYATFLDLFMIITYLTLVIVLVSGILIVKFTEANETARVETVYRWSLLTIPIVTIVLYCLLFVWFLT